MLRKPTFVYSIFNLNYKRKSTISSGIDDAEKCSRKSFFFNIIYNFCINISV